MGGSFQGFQKVFCGFSIKDVVGSNHDVNRPVEVFSAFNVWDYVLHSVGGDVLDFFPVGDVFHYSHSVGIS